MRKKKLKTTIRRLSRKLPLTMLQRMFVLLGALMIVICIVFFSIFSYVYRRNIREIVADEMKSNLARINEYIDLMVKNSDNVSGVLTSNRFLQQYIVSNAAMVSDTGFKEFDALLKDITNSTEFISSMDLYVRPHKMLFMSDYGATSHLDDSVHAFLEEITEQDGSLRVMMNYRRNIGTLYMRTMENITMIRPLYSMYTGEKAGFLAMNVEPISFQRILRTLQGSQCIILNDDSHLVVEVPLGGEGESLVADGRFLIPLPERDGVTFRKVEGREYVFVTASIDTVGWRLVSFTSTDALVQKGMGLQNYLIVLILVLVLFLAMAVMLVMRQVTRRVQMLIELMDRVKGGDFKVDFRAQGADEFSYLFASFNSMVQNVDTLFNEIYRLELMHKDVQLRLLQSQMNPHFIYNIFNNMNWLIQLRRYDELETLVDAVAVFYSRSLNDGKMLITVRGSTEKLLSYIQIQQIRFRDRFTFEMNVDEALMEVEILNHLIQPLLENAFAHGIEPISGKHFIELAGRREEADIIFTVRDDGAGIARERLLEIRQSLETENVQGEFFALQNVSHRIKIYYGDAYGLVIDSEEGAGTAATIRIPYPKSANGEGGGELVPDADR